MPGSSSSAACAGTSIRRRSAIRSTRPTRPATRRTYSSADHDYFTSVRAGAIYRADAGADLLRLLQHLVQPVARAARLDDGYAQPLPPETNEAFEVGAKYEFLNGNLSLNGALFQITKNNARSQNADGTFTADGHGPGAGRPRRRRRPHHAGMAGVRRLHLPRRRSISSDGQRRRRTTGKVPLNTPRDSANAVDDLHLRQEVGDRRRRHLCRPALRQQHRTRCSVPDYIRVRRDGGLQAAGYDVRLNVFNLINRCTTTS